VNHHDFDIRKRVCRKEHELYENLVDHHFDIKKRVVERNMELYENLVDHHHIAIKKRVVERNMSCMKTWWIIITLLLKKGL